MAIRVSKSNSSAKNQSRRHYTSSLDSPTASEFVKESAKPRKLHTTNARTPKARATMACERCKHKKVKCEDYIEGKGCEKCRGSNEQCMFHRKEVEIKTSFRQGYVENCERECENLKELVIRLYRDVLDGNPLKAVDLGQKDGAPNITALMHEYGIALGEEFQGTYEARDAKLASEGQPMLTHNGKGDIMLQQAPNSPESMDDSSSEEPESPLQTSNGRDSAGSPPTRSQSPSDGHDILNASRPPSRAGTPCTEISESFFFDQTSILNKNIMAEATEFSSGMHPSPKMRSPINSQLTPVTPVLQEHFPRTGNMDSCLSTRPQWASQYGSYPNSSTQHMTQGLQSDSFPQVMFDQRKRPGSNSEPMNAQLVTARGFQPNPLLQDFLFTETMGSNTSDELRYTDSIFNEYYAQNMDDSSMFDFKPAFT